MKQLIQVLPGGSLVGLRVAKGKGVDLRDFGQARIERSTEIDWSERYQRFFICFKKKPGVLQHSELLTRTGIRDDGNNTLDNGAAMFREYEDAVTAEIAYIQAVREQNDPGCL